MGSCSGPIGFNRSPSLYVANAAASHKVNVERAYSSFFRSFCIYAALATTFAYVMMITFFVAVMTFDVKRIKSGRRDCLPVCQAPQPKDGEAPWDEPRPQSSNRIMKSWSTFLMHPASKFFVLILSLVALSMGIYGTTKVTERLVAIQ